MTNAIYELLQQNWKLLSLNLMVFGLKFLFTWSKVKWFLLLGYFVISEDLTELSSAGKLASA